MKQFIGLHFTALLVLSVSFVNGANYMFDQTCTPEMRTFIQGSLDSVAAMANAARAALEGNRSPAIQTVLDYLFDPTKNTGAGEKYGSDVFAPISQFTSLVTSNSDLDLRDIKFYCDESRISLRKKKPQIWYDSDIQQQIKGGPQCKIGRDFTLAYSNFVIGKGWHQVQLCPSLLYFAMPAQYKWTTALFSKSFWAKVTTTLMKEYVARTQYTPIDAVSLFDKVLLHELTHTNVDFPTHDVLGFRDSYGWKNCVALSTTVTDGGTGKNPAEGPWGPERNADTWALFGSIAWQLANGRITGMNKDGTFNTV